MNERMKALRRFPYAGKMLAAGDEFEAPKKDAHVLHVLGHAARVASPAYATRMMAARIAPEPVAPLDVASMDLDALRAECARRGLKHHHRAGAATLRALIEAA